jgi:hypothetical protein
MDATYPLFGKRRGDGSDEEKGGERTSDLVWIKWFRQV